MDLRKFITIASVDLCVAAGLWSLAEADAKAAMPKAEAAAARLKAANSGILYEAVTEDLNVGTVERIIAGATVVVDGLDNFHTRALLNQACVKHAVPWVYGACLATYGNAATFLPGTTACLHCILPGVGEAATPPVSCETVGVLGPAAALVAAWQAAEALKIALGRKADVARELMHFDLWDNEFSGLPMARLPACPVCGLHQYDLLERGDRMATAALCGRDTVQVMPPASFRLDFDLLRETLGRIGPVEENAFLMKFRADGHDVVVFRDGRAMVFGLADPTAALSLYGKYIGG